MVKPKSVLRLVVITLLISVLPLTELVHAATDTSAIANARVLNLSTTISMALDQNRDIMSSKQDVAKSHAQVREAWSNALPSISVSSTYLRYAIAPQMFFNGMSITTSLDNSYSASAQISQPLLSRKVGIALDVAKLYDQYTDKGYQSSREATIRAATRAFYQVLLTRKLVDVNREGLNVATANRDNIRAQYQNGTAAEYDLLRSEVQVANTEPLVIAAENNLELSKNALKNLLAIPLNDPIKVEGDFEYSEVSLDEIAMSRSSATANNTILQQLRLQENMLTKNVKIEQAGYWPTLYLIGNYNLQTQDNTFHFSKYKWNDAFAYGLTFSFTPFDGFRTSARVQQAAADLKKIQLARVKAEEGLQLQIQASVNQMLEAKKRIQAQSKGLEQAQKALQIAQTRFRNGIGTQLELLDTQAALTQAQTSYSVAIYDYLSAKTDWQYFVGSIRQ